MRNAYRYPVPPRALYLTLPAALMLHVPVDFAIARVFGMPFWHRADLALPGSAECEVDNSTILVMVMVIVTAAGKCG